jgi:hypothetical protein
VERTALGEPLLHRVADLIVALLGLLRPRSSDDLELVLHHFTPSTFIASVPASRLPSSVLTLPNIVTMPLRVSTFIASGAMPGSWIRRVFTLVVIHASDTTPPNDRGASSRRIWPQRRDPPIGSVRERGHGEQRCCHAAPNGSLDRSFGLQCSCS